MKKRKTQILLLIPATIIIVIQFLLERFFINNVDITLHYKIFSLISLIFIILYIAKNKE